MSKFANHLHLIDTEHPKIVDKEYRGTTHPFEKQQVCVLDIKLPALNSRCEDCVFSDVCTTQGKVDEMGIGGMMSNQGDGLKSVKHNPSAGITLRKPHAVIMAQGQMYICRNPNRKASTIFLMEKDPGCADFREKQKVKEK